MTASARYDDAVASGTTITGWRDIAEALDKVATEIERAVSEDARGAKGRLATVTRLRDRATDARARADRMAAQQEVVS